MPKKKKVFWTVLAIFLIVLFALIVIWIKWVPVGKIEFLQNSNGSVSRVLCLYPIQVSGDSMSPILSNGERKTFDKCFDGEDLKVGLIVLYQGETDTVMRLGIIRSMNQRDGLVYQVSNERELDQLRSVSLEEIAAISEIDTSNSKYNYNQKVDEENSN